MARHPELRLSLLALVLVPQLANGFGNQRSQEKSDVEARTLRYYLNDHNAVYAGFTDTSTNRSNSTNLDNHSILEMVGVVDTVFDATCSESLFQKIASTQGITERALGSFETQAHTFYWGSYYKPQYQMLRGTGVPAAGSRSGVSQVANDLLALSDVITYAASTDTCLAIVLFSYGSLINPAQETIIEPTDIASLRSDAFVEYSFARSGRPLLAGPLDISQPRTFRFVASNASRYLPSWQTKFLSPAAIEAPQIELRSGGRIIENGGATPDTAVQIKVDDALSGPYRLELYTNECSSAPWRTGILTALEQDTTSYLFTVSDIPELGNLPANFYTVRAIDQAGNTSEARFSVSGSSPSQESQNSEQQPVPAGALFSSSQCLVAVASHTFGVGSVNFRESSGANSSTATLSCGLPSISTRAFYGPFCELSPGSTYTITACSCAGVCSEEDVPVETGQYQISICVESPQTSKCASASATADQIRASSMTILADWNIKTGGGAWAPYWITPSFGGATANDGAEWWRGQQGLGVGVGQAVSMNFTVINSTNQGTSLNNVYFKIILSSGPSARAEFAGDPEFTLAGDGAQVAYGTVTISQVYGQQYPTTGGTSSATATAPFKGPILATADCTDDPWWLAALKRLLRFGTSCRTITGSDIVLTSSGSITFHFQEASGVSIDTSTLHVYRFDGVDWSSSQVTSQLVFKDTATGVITATGSWIRGGLFAAMFAGQDSSAPVTTLSFQGSTRSFLTDVFVSTDAYVVLSATDPAVSGYASQLATTYYRLDATTAAPDFTAYSSSISLPLGFHVLEYRSVDWAGNFEPIRASTFLVTMGTLFRASARLSSRGALLAGYQDSAALFEVEARAEDDLALSISSPNASPLLSADNIGDIGLGLSQMSARFDVQGGTPTLAALALRSGNSIASTSSVQIAFGYNGEPSMRHAITTTHSTDTVGNRMDFYVWNPLAPSTSSIASMDVLALQASTITSGGVFHVRPVGNPIGGVELIVSDGVTPGGGSVLRADARIHSSRALKSDIRLLTPQERAAAARDALTLKHSRFNYKSEPAGTPPHTGVMHEDAPASIRGPGGSVSLDARLLNLEVALQETAQRLKRLRERMRRLETR